MPLDIFILNRNGSAYILDCLNRLSKSTCQDFHILFIDDCSKDNSVEIVKQWAQDHSYIQKMTFEKVTFQEGCPVNYNIAFNRFLKNSNPYILILNNDVLLQPDVLEKLIPRMDQNPTWGILSPQIKNYPDTQGVWFSKGYCLPWVGVVMRSHKARSGLTASAMIPTCCVLIRKEALRRMPPLDERYFVGYWDMELGINMQKDGYSLIVDNDLVALHYGSKTIGPLFNRFKQYYYNRNRLLFFSKNIHPDCVWLFLFIQAVVFIPFFLLATVALGKWNSIPFAFCGYRDFVFKKFGKNSQLEDQ